MTATLPPASTGSTQAQSTTWRLGEHSTHFDPLLDSLVSIARVYGITTTQEALSAGLPLENNLLTPALLPRAAARAGLTARITRRKLSDLRPGLLPAILMLQDKQACLLLEWTDDGQARVRFPEAGSRATCSAKTLWKRCSRASFFCTPSFQIRPPHACHGRVEIQALVLERRFSKLAPLPR